jgi:hypothetical protein
VFRLPGEALEFGPGTDQPAVWLCTYPSLGDGSLGPREVESLTEDSAEVDLSPLG